MIRYRIRRKFAWNKTSVTVLLYTFSTRQENIWLRYYYYIEKVYETYTGEICSKYTVNYKNKKDAENVLRKL